jgi:hypothetical protein
LAFSKKRNGVIVKIKWCDSILLPFSKNKDGVISFLLSHGCLATIEK